MWEGGNEMKVENIEKLMKIIKKYKNRREVKVKDIFNQETINPATIYRIATQHNLPVTTGKRIKLNPNKSTQHCITLIVNPSEEDQPIPKIYFELAKVKAKSKSEGKKK